MKEKSRPPWARELKLLCGDDSRRPRGSRPPWARELKLLAVHYAVGFRKSRPPWARELKHDGEGTRHGELGRAPRGRVN